MGLIRRLPESVQNKIAAGEVVERPASVVKELVENSLDAGAENVSVELEAGGHRLIRVADDGAGMTEDDLVLAVERHATSKIADVDDIFRISSMGFRGEALPSIASVSRTTITTCPAGAEASSQLEIEAGRALRLSPAKQRRGTLAEVRDLFFNTPARRKFLRSPRADNALAAKILTRLALAHPQVGFRLQVDGAITFSAHPAAAQLDRIAEIFGDGIAKKLLPLRRDSADGIAVDGFIAAPPEGRHNSDDIYFLVNRRWIKHFGMASALANVFKSALPGRRYPFAIVNLTIDPERLDVNVHPTKEEIRFDNEALVKAVVCAAAKDALEDFASHATAVPRLVPRAPGDGPTPPFPGGAGQRPGRDGKGSEAGGGAPRPSSRRDIPPDTDWPAIRERIRRDDPAPPPSAPPPPRASAAPGFDAPPPKPLQPAVAPAGSGGKLFGGGRYRVLGQVCGQYILIEGEEGLYFIDPHALHERWNFDRMRAEGGRGVASTKLLLPVRLRLSPAEAALAPDVAAVLSEHGFDLHSSDGFMLEVRAAPSYLKPGDIEDLVKQVFADVDGAADAVGVRRERLLASLACRSSVLLGRTLPEEELTLLIDRFLSGGQMPTCPHGRPTGFVLSLDEMAKRLGR